jgi:phage terminase Nu1 subunit (DNA packaging protein)
MSDKKVIRKEVHKILNGVADELEQWRGDIYSNQLDSIKRDIFSTVASALRSYSDDEDDE